MHWECERGCGQASGSKPYPSAEEARRYAAAFDRTGELGKQAPLIGLLPLRLWHKLRQSRPESARIKNIRLAGRSASRRTK
jgi:hypothetical protein